jgi:hypothetical protein
MRYPGFILCVLLAALPASLVFPQSLFKINDLQKVQLEVNQLQQDVQRSRPGSIALEYDTITIEVDGVLMRGPEFVQSFIDLFTSLPSRSPGMANPLPDKLGTLWDFEIVEPQYQFEADTCKVDFQYRLLATSVRTHSGRIVFARFGGGWRLTKLDGLLPLLSDELSFLRNRQEGRGRIK